MTKNLDERLRGWPENAGDATGMSDAVVLMIEAANKIERLEIELTRLREERDDLVEDCNKEATRADDAHAEIVDIHAAVLAAHSKGFEECRARAAKCAEDEPNFPGEPSYEEFRQMFAVGPILNARGAGSAMKKAIAKAIRSLSPETEGLRSPEVKPACPQCNDTRIIHRWTEESGLKVVDDCPRCSSPTGKIPSEEEVARVIANTNEVDDRWARSGRAEHDRRLAEARAVLKLFSGEK